MPLLIKSFKINLLAFLLGLISTQVNAQISISGVINDYSKVTSIDFPTCQICDTTLACMNNIQVQNSSLFKEGDKVLIIQMKGAAVDVSNTATGGQVTDIGNAGNYEFFNVKRVVGNSVYPLRQLTRTYDVPGQVQLVKVPTYKSDVTVVGQLTALPWNPAIGTGGVLALFVEGDLTLNADMSVAGMGYIGETVNVNGSPDHCGINPLTQMNKPATSMDVSPKGNGITIDDPLVNGGRAPRANGGGGGVSGDSGGGGGSNYGSGGNGGDRWCSQAARAGGIGGYPLVPYLNMNKVFLGGAGGPGFVTSGNSAEAANGGGIIVIKANNIIGNNKAIDVSGTSPLAPGAGIDGGGGGGAGGSVALATNSVIGLLDINLNGGDGQKLGTPTLHGPGGGGGGGALLHTLPVFPANINVNINGGIAGTHSGANWNNTNNATPGEIGGIVYVKDVIREFVKGFLDVGNPTCTACNGTLNIKDFSATTALTYSIDGGASFTGSSLFLNLCKDTFQIQVVDEDGCVFDTIIENEIDINTLDISAGNDTAVCEGFQVQFGQDLGSDFTYEWSNNSVNPFIIVDTTGQYTVEVTDSLGCVGNDTVVLLVELNPDLNLQPDTIICKGDTIQFFANINGYNYEWSTGSTDSLISVGEEGEYWLKVNSNLGCYDADSTLLKVVLPHVELPNDTTICDTEFPLLLTGIAQNYTDLLWSTGGVELLDSALTVGSYTLTATDEHGCFDRDTVIVNQEMTPLFSLGNDTNLCDGEIQNFSVIADSDWILLWDDGTIDNNRNVAFDDTISLKIETPLGCIASDTVSVLFHQPNVSLQEDTTLCWSDFPLLISGNGQGFNAMIWNSGSDSLSAVVENEGDFIITVFDEFGCNASDTINVSGTGPTVELPEDTTVCRSSFPIQLIGTANDYNTLSWSTLESTNAIQVDSVAQYVLTAEGQLGCLFSDTINVFEEVDPVFELGPDTTICLGDSVTIDVSNPLGWQLNWEDNSSDTIKTVFESKLLNLSAQTPLGCIGHDTIIVTVSAPELKMPNDTALCEGVSNLTLSPEIKNVSTFIWSNYNPSIENTINKEGTFVLTVVDYFGCELTDSTKVIIEQLPVVETSNDTSVCFGEKAILSAVYSGGSNVLWSTGDTTNSFETMNSGVYECVVTTDLGCSSNDSVKVVVYDYPVLVDLNDTLVCFENGRVSLLANTDSTHYNFYWSHGDTLNTSIIESPGVYIVSVSNEIGCSVSEELEVTEWCPWSLYVANTFTPNGDGMNDVFEVKANNLVEYKILIYNRWGDQIFKSESINDSWDGTLHGNPVQIDTYVYKIYYKYEELSGVKSGQKTGIVNLIR